MQFKYAPYSPTKMDTAVCGFWFHKKYVEKDKAEHAMDTVAQARGSVVHIGHEYMTRKMLQDYHCTFSLPEIRNVVAQAVQKHPAAYAEVGEILQMLELYSRRRPPVLESDATVEHRFAVKVLEDSSFEACEYDDPTALARGIADISMFSADTTEVLIYDHKTQPNIEEADTWQLGFYSWVFWKSHPFLSKVKTVLHFSRYGVYSEPHEWTREDLVRFEDELLTRIQIIEDRTHFEATPNKQCQYCPYIAQCPAMKDLIEVEEDGNYRVKAQTYKCLGDVQKAVKAAGYLAVLGNLYDKIQKELKEHVKLYGPIAIPGTVYEFRAGEEKINWDIVNKKLRDAAYKIFEKHKVDPRMFMGFSQTFSKNVWMLENEALLKELSALFPKERETKFGGFKA